MELYVSNSKKYDFKVLSKSLNKLMNSKEVRNKIVQSLEKSIVKVI